MPRRCALGCKSTDVALHSFPNPNKYPERFKIWVSLTEGEIQMLPDDEIYKTKRICDIHFEDKYRNRFKRLNAMAIPSLHLNLPSTFRVEIPDASEQPISLPASPDLDQNDASAATNLITEHETDPPSIEESSQNPLSIW